MDLVLVQLHAHGTARPAERLCGNDLPGDSSDHLSTSLACHQSGQTECGRPYVSINFVWKDREKFL